MANDLIRSALEEHEENAPRFVVEPDITVAELLHKANMPVPIWDNVFIVINGTPISQDNWDKILLVEEDSIQIFVRPMGDSGKEILRLVAFVAVAVVATMYAGPLATTLFGTTSWGTAVVGAAITVVGALAINALIPPPTPAFGSDGRAPGASYFIGGQSNRIRPGELVPIVYGHHKMIANLGAPPEVWNIGNKSRFTALYDWGLGHVAVDSMRAGDTPLEMFNPTVRHLRGVPTAVDPLDMTKGVNPVRLTLLDYPLNTTDLNVGLEAKGDEGEVTTAIRTNEAVLELQFPSGVAEFADNGEEGWHAVKFEILYRKHGTTDDYQPIPANAKGYTAYPLSWCKTYAGDGSDTPGNRPPGNPGNNLRAVMWATPVGDPSTPPNDWSQPLVLGKQDRAAMIYFRFPHKYVHWKPGLAPPHGYPTSPLDKDTRVFRVWDSKQDKPWYINQFRVRKAPVNPHGYPVDSDGIMLATDQMTTSTICYAVEVEHWGLLVPMGWWLEPFFFGQDFYYDQALTSPYNAGVVKYHDPNSQTAYRIYWDIRYDRDKVPLPGELPAPGTNPDYTPPVGTPAPDPGEPPVTTPPPAEIPDVPDLGLDVFDQTPGNETFVEISERRVSGNWVRIPGGSYRVMVRGQSIAVEEENLYKWKGQYVRHVGLAHIIDRIVGRGLYALAFVPDPSQLVIKS